MIRQTGIFVGVAAALVFANGSARANDSLKIEPYEGVFYLDGVFDKNTPKAMEKARRKNEAITTFVMLDVPGSDDENEYLEVAFSLRAAGLTTIVPKDGLIASGGTDFFLAGQIRIIEPGACIGVHSWQDDGPPMMRGSALPRNHEEHSDFLEYLDAINIDREFYWFTLTAAGPDDMHWMSNAEINRFGMTTRKLPPDTEPAADRKRRCDRR